VEAFGSKFLERKNTAFQDNDVDQDEVEHISIVLQIGMFILAEAHSNYVDHYFD